MGMGKKKSKQTTTPTVAEKPVEESQAYANVNAQERADENANGSLLASDSTKDDDLLKRQTMGTV